MPAAPAVWGRMALAPKVGACSPGRECACWWAPGGDTAGVKAGRHARVAALGSPRLGEGRTGGCLRKWAAMQACGMDRPSVSAWQEGMAAQSSASAVSGGMPAVPVKRRRPAQGPHAECGPETMSERGVFAAFGMFGMRGWLSCTCHFWRFILALY